MYISDRYRLTYIHKIQMGFSLFYHARSPNLHVPFHHPVVYVCTVSKNEKKIQYFS